MPTEAIYGEFSHDHEWRKRAYAWEQFYNSRGVAVGRSSELARRKADLKSKPLPNR